MNYPWLQEVRKASARDEEELARIEALMALFSRNLRTAFLDAIKQIAGRIDLGSVAELISAGRIGDAIAVVNEHMVREGLLPLTAEIKFAHTVAARDTLSAAAGAALLSFDPTGREAVRVLDRYEFDVLRGLTGEALATVRIVVMTGATEHRHPAAIARQVKDTIGLTANQAQAVLNYRKALETRDRRALQRVLRDRRFDRSVLAAISSRTPLAAEKIDRMAERYEQRFLAFRADTIARTEAQRAANGGQHLAWQQMIETGKIPETAVRRDWRYTHDDRTRDAHRAIPAMNPSGVGMHDRFQTPLGPLLYPGDPAGVAANVIGCRCTVLHRIDWSLVKAAT